MSDFLDPPVTPDGKKIHSDCTVDIAEYYYTGLTYLSPEHLKNLTESSAISPAVIGQRGYRSIPASICSSLQLPKQDGLAIPIRDRDGHFVQIQIRFDTEPLVGRKKLRYLSPGGMELRLDFPSPSFPLGDSDEIWITEGAKKADALRSRGLWAVSVPGIWGWSGKEARKDLSKIPQDRTVLICYDAETKPRTRKDVEKATLALSREVKKLGITNDVKIVELPLPDAMQGSKMGIDDYLAAGGKLEDLSRRSPSAEWKQELVLTQGGEIRINHFNLMMILKHDPDLPSVFFDELVGQIKRHDGKKLDIIEFCTYIEGTYKTGHIGAQTMSETLETHERENASIHPIRDYLIGLTWDGVPRIETLFPRYYGSPDTEYHRSTGKNLLIASVARMMRPGCKFDCCVVLEGPQGIKKSSSIGALFGECWSTLARSDIHDKDFIAGMIGFWAIEIAELASLRKSDIEAIKSILSATFDDIRLSYRRDVERFPRQCVCIATTNERAYLSDATGNRRFWPIQCGDIDLEAIKKDRDQLWAEAMIRFENGESWWKVPSDEAEHQQNERIHIDTWEEAIEKWLMGHTLHPTTTDILGGALGLEVGKHDRQAQTRVGVIMTKLKYGIERTTRDSIRVRVYVPLPPEEVPF